MLNRFFSHKASGKRPEDLRHRAEMLAAQIPPMMLERTAPWRSMFGRHPSRRAGPGDQFWQFRRYHPGDAASTIDWRRSASAQHIHVREREFETRERVVLWCDRSPSMDFTGSTAPLSKKQSAIILTLALAIILDRLGEHVQLAAGGREEFPARYNVEEMARALSSAWSGGDHDFPLPQVNRRSNLILISDWLTDLTRFKDVIAGYEAERISGLLIQILDPAEADLPYHGHVLFEGLEEGDGRERIENVDTVRSRYQRHLAAWQDELRGTARSAGWPFLVHRTDRPLLDTLIAVLAGLKNSS